MSIRYQIREFFRHFREGGLTLSTSPRGRVDEINMDGTTDPEFYIEPKPPYVVVEIVDTDTGEHISAGSPFRLIHGDTMTVRVKRAELDRADLGGEEVRGS